jgi:trehalose/maltose hydrolase-like predicted phosphorylase
MLSAWKISYEYFNPAEERLRETLCTLGNGYFATRGAAPEASASKFHYSGTYIAGVYNTLATKIAGRTVYNDDIVNCPNWLVLTFRIGEDDWITPETCEVLSYHQELDMKRGILAKKMKLQDKKGRISSLWTQRIIHMAHPHCAAISCTIVPENYDGWIVIKSALDGTVQNKGVQRYKDLNSEHLTARSMGTFGKRAIFLAVHTAQSDITICEASKIRIVCGKEEIKPSREILTKEKKKILQEFRISVRRNQRYTVEKVVSLYTSRDHGVTNPVSKAVTTTRSLPGFSELLTSHTSAWRSLWDRFDITIKGDIFSQTLLRFHMFHLIQTASVHNTKIDAGLPARGLHGEAYRGHIFWDTVYIMHFYDMRSPEISKALLLYRYRRLAQARKYARSNKYEGAMFPWQSSATGEEETQVIHLNPKSGKWDPDHSRIQRHISFALAYNIWQYWQRTGDIDFMINYGAEMLLSIAQFGSSLAKYDRKDGKYHTEGIMGPDEFHEKYPGSSKPGIKDNSYTNLLLAWTMSRAEETLKILPPKHRKRLSAKLKIKQSDLDRWRDITQKMNVVIDNEGIIAQFDGYFDLKELNWSVYRIRYDNIKRLDRILRSEGLSPDEYKVAKQADSLMIFYILPLYEIKSLLSRLGYTFTKDMLRKNYDYYITRTSHGSTLSKVVHCYLAHLLGRKDEAWEWFMNILKSDIHDTQGGTTRESIHAGVMGGSIDIAMRAFAGIEILDDRIKIDPDLPPSWESVKLKILFKKHVISLTLSKNRVVLFIEAHEKAKFTTPIEVREKLYRISPGRRRAISLTAP